MVPCMSLPCKGGNREACNTRGGNTLLCCLLYSDRGFSVKIQCTNWTNDWPCKENSETAVLQNRIIEITFVLYIHEYFFILLFAFARILMKEYMEFLSLRCHVKNSYGVSLFFDVHLFFFMVS